MGTTPNADDETVVRREVTLETSSKREKLVVEVSKPTPESKRGPYACHVSIAGDRKIYRTRVRGEDSLQAMTLALRVADRKLRAIAAREKGEVFHVGADLPPVFTELEAVDRLGGSLANLSDALSLAWQALRDTELTPAARRRVARKIAPVLESVGVVDMDGVHLSRKTPAHWERGWTETKTAASRGKKSSRR